MQNRASPPPFSLFSRNLHISLSLSSLHVFLLLIFPYTTSTPLFPLLLHFISLLSRQFFPEVIPDKRIPGDNKAAVEEEEEPLPVVPISGIENAFLLPPLSFFSLPTSGGAKESVVRRKSIAGGWCPRKFIFQRQNGFPRRWKLSWAGTRLIVGITSILEVIFRVDGRRVRLHATRNNIDPR